MVAQQVFLIRDARPEDMSEILAIEYKCFPDPYPLSLLNRLHATHPDGFLVAEVGSKVIGYLIGAVRWGPIGHILAIGVDPAFRRHGIGSAMVQKMIERFARKGARLVRLEARKSNFGAHQFYRRLGFKDRMEVPYYYEDGETALTMEMPLGGSPVS
ncbi:MAG: ribosomal protein S18-alanine N-acetyltransferase [Candidatus Hadarchaeota archaeon]